MDEFIPKYNKGDEVYILSLNTLATIQSCIVVEMEEYYKITGNPTVMFSVQDLYKPVKIMSKSELVDELDRIHDLNMPEGIEQKMKVRALLEYIDDPDVFYKMGMDQ